MNTHRILAAALCSSALFVSPLTGCSEKAPGSDGAHSDHSGHDHAATEDIVRTDVYDGILGEITALPIAGDPSSELKIHHEHIPTFRTKQGIINVNSKGIAGMNAMEMPFPPADGLSLDGLAVGDKVRFTFAVNWGGQRAWEVTEIEKLAADTVIDYSVKPTPEGVLPDGDHTMPGGEDHDAGHDDHSGHDHDEP